jgi:hypothetical protein
VCPSSLVSETALVIETALPGGETDAMSALMLTAGALDNQRPRE